MRHLALLLLASVSASCAQVPTTPIHKIYDLCRKDKSDPVVLTKFKELGLADEGGGKGYFRYYEPRLRTDYKFILVVINPQPTLNSIQGFFITWKKDLGGLTYEEVQRMVGVTLPKRDAKVIRTDQAMDYSTKYYVLGHENSKHPDLTQVTVTCAKNNYDRCWEIDIACFGFVHPD